MATYPGSIESQSAPPPRMQLSCEFTQVLMKLQRATYLIASTLDLDALLQRVVNDIASSVGNVEVSVWLRDSDREYMVLRGVRGCTKTRTTSPASQRHGRR